MESVHKTATRPWISKRINVRKFRDDWLVAIMTKNQKCSKLKDKISAEEYAEIEKECSIAAMRCPNQQCIEIGSELLVDHFNLETLRIQKEELAKRKSDFHYDAVAYNNARYNNYPLVQNEIASNFSKEEDFVAVKEPEVILTVQIYRPEKCILSGIKNPNSRFPIFHIDQEFMVLGSQCLTELRDRIDCVSDKAIPGDHSENPNQPVDATCKDLYKSGFFYIDGAFYNDMRDRDSRDYSEIIMNWAKKENRGIGPFRKTHMEYVKFIDLEIQLGYPYVYVHQGNCEHFIVFNDLVMFGSHHRRNRKEYPLYNALKPKKRLFCMVCHMHMAEWVVFNNKRVPETPFYFCKSCFFSFNYDKNNKKIGEFEAYHHIDRSTIL